MGNYAQVSASNSEMPRMRRELRTFEVMIGIDCAGHHKAAGATAASTPRVATAGASGLCLECHALLDYAACRLAVCPFGTAKPAFADCPVHCYRPAMKEAVKQVMRYAGPRMLLRHPFLALMHEWDRFIHRRGGKDAARTARGKQQAS